MKELKRGEIYFVNFPYTFDKNYKEGKPKFVLVLQEGEYFLGYDTVVVLTITSDKEEKGYLTSVTIEKGTTKLHEESYVICAQPYTVHKKLFEQPSSWCAGRLSPEKMNEIDEALYIGLCMGENNY